MQWQQAREAAGGIVFVAATILLGCLAGFKDFFFIDDAQNEYLPFFTEMGRLWRAGELPVLTTRTWFGGNMLLDMVLSPFAPQTIVASIVAAGSATRAPAVLTFAGLNILLVAFSGCWLGRLFGLAGRWPLLLGFILATQPVFLFVFSASWWNNAAGYAWFLFSFAAMLQLRRSMSATSFLLASAGIASLFATAMPQFQLACGLACAFILVADLRENRSVLRIVTMALAPLCALLVAAVPLMAEYLLADGWITRVSGWHNMQSTLVPNWGMLLNTFNPFQVSHIGWFGQMSHLPPSLGYSTALLFFAIVFFRLRPAATVEQRLLAPWALLTLVLCFLPSQTGPMRYPMRFLPLFALPLSIYALQRVALGTPRIGPRTLARAMGFIAVVAVLTFLTAGGQMLGMDALLRLALVPALFGGGTWLLLTLRRQGDRPELRFAWAATVSFLAWFLPMMLVPSLGGANWPYTGLPESGDIPPDGRPGYVVSVCDGGWSWPPPTQLAELVSGRFLLYGHAAINGYSPVGHKGLARTFPSGTPQGYFHAPRTLDALARPAPEVPGAYLHQMFQISDVFACERHLDAQRERALIAAGFERVPAALEEGRHWFRATNQLAATGSLLGLPDATGVTAAAPARPRQEAFDVPARPQPRRLHFARLYWPGYEAELDGRPLTVRAYHHATVEVELPPGASGRMVLRYTPASWRWTRWSILAGLLLGAATAAALAPASRRLIVPGSTACRS